MNPRLTHRSKFFIPVPGKLLGPPRNSRLFNKIPQSVVCPCYLVSLSLPTSVFPLLYRILFKVRTTFQNQRMHFIIILLGLSMYLILLNPSSLNSIHICFLCYFLQIFFQHSAFSQCIFQGFIFSLCLKYWCFFGSFLYCVISYWVALSFLQFQWPHSWCLISLLVPALHIHIPVDVTYRPDPFHSSLLSHCPLSLSSQECGWSNKACLSLFILHV